MAESNLTAPIFRWATGWLSDDLFTGIKDSFFASKNINIRDLAEWITLNKSLVPYWWTGVVTEWIVSMFETSNGYKIAFGNAWWIYYKPSLTWVKIVTDSPATEIYSATEFNGYLYRTTSGKLHRLLTTNLSGNITATDEINRQTLQTSPYYPLLVSMWDLYVGHKGRVDKVNISNVWETIMTIESNWYVEFLNELGSSVRIITRSPTGNNNLHLWDWISTNPDQTVSLKWYDIKQSIIHNGFHYLVTNKWLGVMDWYKIHPIKKIEEFNGNFNSVSVFNEKLHIWGNGWVYVYGAKDIKYPEVLNLAYSSSNGQSSDTIYAIFSNGVDLWVSWGNGSSYGIDVLSETRYYTSWYLDTKAYYADSLKSVKESIGALIWYAKLITAQQLSLYYSVDGWAYTKIIDIDSTTVTNDLRTEELLFQTGSFQYIQFRIMLGWDWTNTPTFNELDFIFNKINR